MKTRTLLILFFVACAALTATNALADDTDQIKEAALNYLEGYFQSDPVRMEKALHPNLFKCTVRKFQGTDTEVLRVMTAEELIAICYINQEWVKDKVGVKSLDVIYQDPRIAVVHAVSDGFYDVISLMKLEGEWKIVQVLWDGN